MSKFTNKRVVVEAFHMTEEGIACEAIWPEWLREAWKGARGVEGSVWRSKVSGELYCGSLAGHREVSVGDYLVRSDAYGLYPSHQCQFEALYDKVEESLEKSEATEEQRKQISDIFLELVYVRRKAGSLESLADLLVGVTVTYAITNNIQYFCPASLALLTMSGRDSEVHQLVANHMDSLEDTSSVLELYS